ncbi:ATP-dependent RNA helicase DBP3 [Tripterygium wilfordii]|uniref:ATP-dependent RNA helicase DBP3 n=1 Tax=Tripterygium wilfordii TaxID=458696 RepID=A0A7J7C6G5_TRIWF|nr:probable ATP-dependent RNA helicase ddx5 [Tripterygium wilfordii]KAF5729437.1 ATP-dependent RNA helicase DBP3 [Tripterygium wilfordii]
MAKGDDIVRRKKNKENRKKLQRDPASKVSARVAAVIAAKKRRKTGKRSMCQGMCFSLPTPEDPFNDKYSTKKDPKKPSKVEEGALAKGKPNPLGKGLFDGKKLKTDHVGHLEVKHEKVQTLKNGHKKPLMPDNLKQTGYVDGRTKTQMDLEADDHYTLELEQTFENSDCPSKFLILCLNAIESDLRLSGSYKIEEKPLFVNYWGVEFWKCYSVGKDILDLSGGSSRIEQIAWLASTAADTIARKEKEGLSFHSPFLLFLVPSQEKGTKVRSVCKPLKALGIHTVSLHPGASLQHQIHGLKSCEPEFLVSTPERLLELVSMKAIDISGVSFLVVDGIEAFCESSCLDAIQTIKQSISGNPLTLVFNDCSNSTSIPALQNLLSEPVSRLSLSGSFFSQSASILRTCQKKKKLVKPRVVKAE